MPVAFLPSIKRLYLTSTSGVCLSPQAPLVFPQKKTTLAKRKKEKKRALLSNFHQKRKGKVLPSLLPRADAVAEAGRETESGRRRRSRAIYNKTSGFNIQQGHAPLI